MTSKHPHTNISNYFEKPPTRPIKKDDIVYAKYKGLYWPALVRSVYPKQKKLCIWYCDHPGKTFKLPLKNVCAFNDSEKRAEIEKHIQEAGRGQYHERLTDHAKDYLWKKTLGYKDDPKKFFRRGYLQKRKSETKADYEKLLVSKLNTLCTSEVYINVKYINKIVKVIKSGKTDNYLKEIWLETVSSEFNTAFEEAGKDGKKDDGSVSCRMCDGNAGHIQDSNKVGELTIYLLSLFDKMVTIHNAAKSDTLKCFIAHYVASVWLPESIIYAIAQIQNISLPEAKQLFKELPNSKKEEIRNIGTTQVEPSQRNDDSSRNKPKEMNAEQLKNECIHRKLSVRLCRITAAELSNKKVGTGFNIKMKPSRIAEASCSGINNKKNKGGDGESLPIESGLNTSPQKNSEETAKSNCSTQPELPLLLGLKSNAEQLKHECINKKAFVCYAVETNMPGFNIKPKEINDEQLKNECINRKLFVRLCRIKAAEISNKKVWNTWFEYRKLSRRKMVYSKLYIVEKREKKKKFQNRVLM